MLAGKEGGRINLIAALRDPKAPHEEISLALQALGRSILPDYLQPLYTSPDPTVRFWAARAGGEMQDVGGMVVLQEFTKDEASPFHKLAVNSIVARFATGGRRCTGHIEPERRSCEFVEYG